MTDPQKIDPLPPEELRPKHSIDQPPSTDDLHMPKTKAQQLKDSIDALEDEDPDAAALLRAKLVQEFVQEEAFQEQLVGLAAARLPIDNFIGSRLEERLLNAVYDAIQEALTDLIETGDVDPGDVLSDLF